MNMRCYPSNPNTTADKQNHSLILMYCEQYQEKEKKKENSKKT